MANWFFLVRGRIKFLIWSENFVCLLMICLSDCVYQRMMYASYIFTYIYELARVWLFNYSDDAHSTQLYQGIWIRWQLSDPIGRSSILIWWLWDITVLRWYQQAIYSDKFSRPLHGFGTKASTLYQCTPTSAISLDGFLDIFRLMTFYALSSNDFCMSEPIADWPFADGKCRLFNTEPCDDHKVIWWVQLLCNLRVD